MASKMGFKPKSGGTCVRVPNATPGNGNKRKR